jgi:AraC-like DNA-binding protein
MKLLVRKPAPPLSCYVESLWYFEYEGVTHRKERALPNGRSQLIIDLADAFEHQPMPSGSEPPAMMPIVVGLQTRYAMLDTLALRCLMGVVFQPGGARGLVDVPADECSNVVIALDDVWGGAAIALRDRLLETSTVDARFAVLEDALLERAMRRRFALHAAVRYGLTRFERAPHICSVLDVAHNSGLSRRRFAEIFREQVGLTPKLYCRVLRFQRVVQQMASGRSIDWRDVALAGGFSDQPHLAHEFRDFSGISLTEYMNTPRMHANHVVVA